MSGLGTSTSKEAKEYFSDMVRHRIPFKYDGSEDDASIVLVSDQNLGYMGKIWKSGFENDPEGKSETYVCTFEWLATMTS